jgi:hypothetical protein
LREALRGVICRGLASIVVLSSVSAWLSTSSGDDKPTASPQPGQAQIRAQTPAQPRAVADSVAIDRFFVEEVWAKVGERTCLKCHNPEGDAAESRFVLPTVQGPGDHDAMVHNCRAFASVARSRDGKPSRLLVKVTGGLDHGGGPILKPGSSGYRILERLVRRLNGEPTATTIMTRTR